MSVSHLVYFLQLQIILFYLVPDKSTELLFVIVAISAMEQLTTAVRILFLSNFEVLSYPVPIVLNYTAFIYCIYYI